MAPPERPLDLMRLLETLARHRVDYLVIGGVAVQVHGHRRTTKDLDLVPDPDPGNVERLAAALDELEARVKGAPETAPPVSPTDAERLAAAPIVPPLTTIHGEVHIVNTPKGAASWAEMRARALVVDLDGIEVPIAGLDDLLRMKEASGRQADLADIAILAALDERSGD